MQSLSCFITCFSIIKPEAPRGWEMLSWGGRLWCWGAYTLLYVELSTVQTAYTSDTSLAGASSLRPSGHMWPRMAMNVAQHNIANLLKTFEIFFVIPCCNVFNVWPRSTLLLQGGPETPKGWTPLQGLSVSLPSAWRKGIAVGIMSQMNGVMIHR